MTRDSKPFRTTFPAESQGDANRRLQVRKRMVLRRFLGGSHHQDDEHAAVSWQWQPSRGPAVGNIKHAFGLGRTPAAIAAFAETCREPCFMPRGFRQPRVEGFKSSERSKISSGTEAGNSDGYLGEKMFLEPTRVS